MRYVLAMLLAVSANAETLWVLPIGGQSLAIGATGTNLLSTNAYHSGYALMWTNGLLYGYDNNYANPSLLNATADLVTASASPNRGETPLAAWINKTMHLWTNAGVPRQKILGATFAYGGTGIESLKPGSTSYSNYVNHITRARSVLETPGNFLGLAGVGWVHGETDTANLMSGIRYKTNLISLANSFRSDWLSAVTNVGVRPPKIFTIQPGNTGYSAVTNCEVAQAIFELGIDDPRFRLVGPNYQFQRGSDGLHLTSDGYRYLGEYYARALWTELNGGTWRGTVPTNVVGTSSNVVISFHVPTLPLVFDTNNVSFVTNYGFAVDGATISGTITVASNVVTIPLSTNATSVRYAWANNTAASDGPTTGQRGNLRDSSSDASIYGYTNLFNWAPIFRLPVGKWANTNY